MAKDLDPIADATQAAAEAAKKWKERLEDWARRYLTVALLKVVLPGAVAAILAVVVFPWFVGAAVVVAVGALVIYAVFANLKLIRFEARLRRQWIGAQKLQLLAYERENAVDRATLYLLGDRQSIMRVRSPDLVATVNYMRQMHALRAAATHSQPPQPAQRSPAAPKPPDLQKIQRRVGLRDAKIAELRAQIQSYSVPENVTNALAAENATRSRRQVEDDALAADRVARDNARQGRRPEPDVGGRQIQLELSIAEDGTVTTRVAPPRLTPEQVARGETHVASESSLQTREPARQSDSA